MNSKMSLFKRRSFSGSKRVSSGSDVFIVRAQRPPSRIRTPSARG